MPSQGHDVVRSILERLPLPQRVHSTVLLLYDAMHNFGEHRGSETAAAIAYYTLFAIFPLILFLMAALGYIFGSSARQADILQIIAENFPGSRELLETTIEQVLQVRSPVTIVATVTLLWSASGVFSQLAVAINRAWCVDCSRPFWEGKLVGLLLALVIGALVLVSIVSSGFIELVNRFGDRVVPPELRALTGQIDVIGVAISAVVTIAILFLMYKIVPTVRVPWRAALLSAIVAGLTFEAARYVFTWYVSTYASRNYTMIYGSLSAVLAFMVWTYVSAMILLIGAEIGARYAQGSFHTWPALKVDGHE